MYRTDGVAALVEHQQGEDQPVSNDALTLSHVDLIAYLADRLDISPEAALATLGSWLVDPVVDERRAQYLRASRARQGAD